MGTCPKCKTGVMRRQSLSSCNWRCELCGYTQYIPEPKANINSGKVYSDINRISAESDRIDAEFKQAVREMNAATSAKRKAPAKAKGKSGGGTIVSIIKYAIIIYIILYIIAQFL